MLSDIFAELLIRSLTLQYSHWDSNPERTDFESAAYAIPPWKLMMMWFLANCLHLYVSHYSDYLRTYKILLQESNLRYYRWRAVACHYTKKQSMSLKKNPPGEFESPLITATAVGGGGLWYSRRPNWAGGIRTHEFGSQSPVPYLLATAQQKHLSNFEIMVSQYKYELFLQR